MHKYYVRIVSMKSYYTLNFYFTQDDLNKQIQTTKSNNPIGLNFF
jgi:hypothetical protein